MGKVPQGFSCPISGIGLRGFGPALGAAILEGENRLNGNGRVVIRKSGTEPLIRVMAEGQDDKLITSVVDDIVATVEELSAK